MASGGSDQPPPEPLDAALIFAPVGALVPAALAATKKGGTVVAGGIHTSDIPSFPYRILWEERVLRSVANLTRRDAEEFLALAPKAGISTSTVTYPLARANDALADLRQGALQGEKPSDAFQVKCDASTTSQTDQQNGIVNIIVAFAPLKPAEFVIIKIAQLAGQTAGS